MRRWRLLVVVLVVERPVGLRLLVLLLVILLWLIEATWGIPRQHFWPKL